MAIEWIEEIPRIRRILAEAETSSRLQAIRSLELILSQEALNLLEEYHASAISFEKFFMERAMKNIKSFLQTGEVPLEIERARERATRIKATLEQLSSLDSSAEEIGIEDVAISLKKSNSEGEHHSDSQPMADGDKAQEHSDPGFGNDHQVVGAVPSQEQSEEDSKGDESSVSGLTFGSTENTLNQIPAVDLDDTPTLSEPDQGSDDAALKIAVDDSDLGLTELSAHDHNTSQGVGLESAEKSDVSDYNDLLPKPSGESTDYVDSLSVSEEDYANLSPVAADHQDDYDDLLPALAPESSEYDDLLPTVSGDEDDYDDLLPAVLDQKIENEPIAPASQGHQNDYDDLLPTISARPDDYDDLLPSAMANEDDYDDLLPSPIANEDDYDDLLPSLSTTHNSDGDDPSRVQSDLGDDDLLPPMESVQDDYEDLLPPLTADDAFSTDLVGDSYDDYDDLLPPIQSTMASDNSLGADLPGMNQTSEDDSYDDLLPPIRQDAEDLPQNEGGHMDLDDLLPPIKSGD